MGGSYGKQEIESAIRDFNGLKATSCCLEEVVRLLVNQNRVIALFGGKSESGRRALGHRSIVADPRSPNIKDIINHKVKHRQWFRPFAPSILKERLSEWFECDDIDSPYMSYTVKVRGSKIAEVPGIVHFDGTARLQTVTADLCPHYFRLISEFEKQTGVPIVLNTSFNDREPIVESPHDAINCFLGTEIDFVYFFEYDLLVSKVFPG